MGIANLEIENLDFSKLNFKHLKQPENIVKERRLASGLTQQEVANILGLSLRQWQRYENWEKPLDEAPFQLGVNICELLHIPLYDAVARLSDLIKDDSPLPGVYEEKD